LELGIQVGITICGDEYLKSTNTDEIPATPPAAATTNHHPYFLKE
jgi:hypothetical protein